MAGASQGMTASEYIVHHLTHWQNQKPIGPFDLAVRNIDSSIYSIVLGVLACALLWFAARKATSDVPGRFQAAAEWLVEMVDAQAKSIVHSAESRKLVSPLALIVFVWILLMNAMDLLPVDLLPSLWGWATGKPHDSYMRAVPTADLSVTMGMSVAVLLICIFYNVRIKGFRGWMHELVCAPFGTSENPIAALCLGVANFSMQLIEMIAKTVSHGMRLFGNMYAGELIFMLIALMGGALLSVDLGTGIGLFLGHVLAGSAWAIFHILIITLQAFVFMMLTLVYIGQAHDAH